MDSKTSIASDDMQTTKFAIAGYGVEGRSTYNYLVGKGAQDITITDINPNIEDIPNNIKTILGIDAFSKLQDFDAVYRSPAVRPDSIRTNGKIWSATSEFFDKCPAKIIGVTGTKGKGTTCSLIAEILRNSGKNVHLLGNIGVPALDELPGIKPEDIVVYEMSSFQLWDLETSPDTAVVLMIEPDHLDVHADMAEYLDAKSNINKYQTSDNLLVFHPANDLTSQVVEYSKARKVQYLTDNGAHVVYDKIIIDGQIICSTDEVGLIGEHNLENITAAITAAWNYTQDIGAIAQACKEFKGLPHRLEYAGEINGTKFYDDSFATGTAATIAALRAFKDKKRVLIFGGSNKNIDISGALDELNDEDQLVLLGETSRPIENLARQKDLRFVNMGSDVTMLDIVEKCVELASDNSVVLLSPAHASLDMFESYKVRGNQFKSAIKSFSN